MSLTPPPYSQQRRSLLLLTLLGGLPMWARSALKELRVLSTAETAAQRQTLEALRARYPGLSIDSDPASAESRRNPAGGPLVTVGPAALKQALDAGLKGPVVSIFTSSQTYRRLSSAAGHDRLAITGIFAEAPPLAQLQLIAALFERRVAVGVLLSEESAHLERPLRQAATQTGIELQVVWVEPDSNVVRSLNQLNGAQVLLAVPDSTLYTTTTLRSVLESTYRRRLPVIGFSSATVAAGTLATAYADVDDVAADLIELLDGLGNQGSGPLPEPRFPRYWRVSVNESVARSLGLAITDKVRALGSRPTTGRPG